MSDMQERDSRIIEMFEAGHTYAVISERLAITRSAVASVCYRAGLRRAAPIQRRSRHAERLKGVDTSAMTIPEIGRFLGISTGAAKMAVVRHGLAYKPQPQGGAAQKVRREKKPGIQLQPRNVAPGPAKRKPPAKRIPPRDPKLFGMKAAPSDPNPMGCRFIHGEPGDPDHRFCGAMRAEAGKPYCPVHAARCYQPHSTLAEIESARREADRGRSR